MTIATQLPFIDATTYLLVEQKGGDTLRSKMLALRQYMLEAVRGDSNAIKPFMPLKVEPVKKTEHNPTADWNIGYFEHMPTVAAIAMFSKFQNDVRSSEALVIKSLFEAAHLTDIKFDTIAAVAVPTTSYALAGDKIEASILLAAFNKANKPEVQIQQGGGSKKEAKNGVIPWETIASGTGLQTVKGTITLNTERGAVKRDWKFEYMVGSTGASMQLDKMNVFYIGVPNPVTVAAAGYSVEDVSIDVPGAKVTPTEKGKYSITVDKVGDIQVAIKAKTKDGTTKNVGGMKIRVKRIPNPIASVGKISGGAMSASLLRIQVAPAAVLENFDFEAKFQIISFQVTLLPRGKDLMGPYTVENKNGARFADNPQVKKMLDQARPGDKVFIENIKAVGPDGQVRVLNSIVLSLT